MFYTGMSFKLRFCCKRQTERTILGKQSGWTWAGGHVRRGLGTQGRAELPLCCARACVCPTLSGLCSAGGASCSAAESRTFTYLFPTNSRILITFETTYFFPSFFSLFIHLGFTSFLSYTAIYSAVLIAFFPLIHFGLIWF